MRLNDKDRDVLRALAARKAEAAADPVNAMRIAQWRRSNNLEQGKPMIWITEVPWHEFGLSERLCCTDPFCRELEAELRKELYQWEHLPGDMVVTETIAVPLVHEHSGFGFEQRGRTIAAAEGSVLAQEYERQIQGPEDIEKFVDPILHIDEEETQRRLGLAQQAFAGILPVEKRLLTMHVYCPWDELVRWWGVQDALMDLMLRPEMVRAALERMTQGVLSLLAQCEAANALARNDANNRVCSGGYGYCDDLPGTDYDAEHVTPMNMWGGAAAQIFGEVSPVMHEEFALEYESRWLERFGLNYYGCCEPLEKKMDILRRRVPRLRKVSMSPWVNMTRAAEEVGDSLVFSYKPNPALLAGGKWDLDTARKQLEADMEIAKNCVVEVILKDISTVGHEPHRLHDWARMAAEIAERFA